MTTLTAAIPWVEKEEEAAALKRFRLENPGLFRKDDSKLALHLGIVLSLLVFFTVIVLTTPLISVKILLGAVNAFLIFSLINVTIHHHHTHHNPAKSPFFRKVLDVIYFLAVPDAPKRLNRYTRAHLNHHARPFHESDLDHHYGKDRYLAMMKTLGGRILYYLELTFIGGHMPGWKDDQYMNTVPLEDWNREAYLVVKRKEVRDAWITAAWQWGGFFILLKFLPWLAWGWVFPMLLVKNWSHFLGQFQHYDDRLTDPERSIANRTKTYHHVPGWLNYLTGGEITGHFLHHLYPEMPYYQVESARRRFLADPELSRLFANY
jgi:fatty acid desaturase